MATLHPFQALRPVPEKVSEIASVPYDVISSMEARVLAEGNPLSFLHIIRPEIDLPVETDEHDPVVYEKGAENLRSFVNSEYAIFDESPALYVYRLTMGDHVQDGIFGCVSVAEYDNNVILKHEKTRPDKEDDRTRHILMQQAHAEPVMLTYKGRPEINRMVAEITSQPPLYDFTAEDGVRHTIWKVAKSDSLEDAFQAVDRLYVADGHHRCKAASRAAAELRAANKAVEMPECEFFPAVLFPIDSMQVLPYNRVIRRLPVAPETFLQQLEEGLEVEKNVESPVPEEPGTICIYLERAWHRVKLPESRQSSPVDRLDVTRLNEFILGPILGITDSRRDPNLDFVGGIRGPGELVERVDNGLAELAISMYPTSIEDLVAVSDAGLLMPPKSTWFEPKLRSGLLVHLF